MLLDKLVRKVMKDDSGFKVSMSLIDGCKGEERMSNIIGKIKKKWGERPC